MIIKKFILFISVVACLTFANCASSQDNHNKMKLTAFKLLNYLAKRDSLGIERLFGDNEMLYKKRKEIINDCKFIERVINKYGYPQLNKFNNVKSKDKGNIAWVRLIDKPDSSINLRKCDLIVYFFPDEIIGSPDKFLNYTIFIEPLTPIISHEIIEAPEIKIQ